MTIDNFLLLIICLSCIAGALTHTKRVSAWTKTFWQVLKISLKKGLSWIILATMIWGTFIFFFNKLPEGIFSTLESSISFWAVRAFSSGFLLIVVFFVFTMFNNSALSKHVFTLFYHQDKTRINMKVVGPILLCAVMITASRFFEAKLFSRGAVDFAIIFCVGLSPVFDPFSKFLYAAPKLLKGKFNRLSDLFLNFEAKKGNFTAKVIATIILILAVIFFYLRATGVTDIISLSSLKTDKMFPLAALSAIFIVFYFHIKGLLFDNDKKDECSWPNGIIPNLQYLSLMLGLVFLISGVFSLAILLVMGRLNVFPGVLESLLSADSILVFWVCIVGLGTIGAYLLEDLGYQQLELARETRSLACEWVCLAALIDPLLGMVLIMIGLGSENVQDFNSALFAILFLAFAFVPGILTVMEKVFEDKAKKLLNKVLEDREVQEDELEEFAASFATLNTIPPNPVGILKISKTDEITEPELIEVTKTAVCRKYHLSHNLDNIQIYRVTITIDDENIIPDRETREPLVAWFLTKMFDEPSNGIYSLTEYNPDVRGGIELWGKDSIILDNEKNPEIIGLILLYDRNVARDRITDIRAFARRKSEKVNKGFINRLSYL